MGFIFIQGTKSAGAQALQNAIMLADLITLSLEVDANGSASFSVSAESISKLIKIFY